MATNKDIQSSAAARLFSAGVVKDLARFGKSALFGRLLREGSLVDRVGIDKRVGDVFEAAFSILKDRDARHEYVYKAAIINKILLGKHSLRTASVLNEFRVEHCKADLAILNGTAAVYEIKSERDSLSRLERQIAAYQKVFAKVNVIAGSNHIENVLGMVPNEVGVFELSDRFQIRTVRDGADLPSRTVPSAMLGSITMDEAKAILKALGISIPDVPNTRLRGELEGLFFHLDPVDTHQAMVSTLKRTRSQSSLISLVDNLPSSLHAAVLSTRMRKQDHARLISAIDQPLRDAVMWG